MAQADFANKIIEIRPMWFCFGDQDELVLPRSISAPAHDVAAALSTSANFLNLRYNWKNNQSTEA